MDDRPYTLKELAQIAAGSAIVIVVLGWIAIFALAIFSFR
jgi:hypothetical protein